VKGLSLEKIQSSYYELIESHLEKIYEEYPIDPYEAAIKYASKNTGKFLFQIFPDFKQEVYDFWKTNRDKNKALIERNPGLKTCYSGDIFPSKCPEFISRIGLYIDTLLLPDPLLKVLSFPKEFMSDRDRVFYIIKHAFNLLNIKNYVLQDFDIPLACIYPNDMYFEEVRSHVTGEESYHNTLHYFEELLGIELSSFDELEEIINIDENELSYKIRSPTLLPPNFYDETIISRGILKGMREMLDSGVTFLNGEPAGKYLHNYIFGRLRGISDHLIDCLEFNSKPIYDVPSSWFMYKWKISNDSKKYGKEIGLDVSTSIVNALQLDNFNWLGNIPLENLIKIREEGGLGEIRSIIRENINEIYECKRKDLESIAREINKNLNEEFRKHETELRKLEKEYQKRLNIQEKLLILGTISITASFIFPPLAVFSLLGGGFIDVLSASEEYLKKIKELNQKPVGVMFNAYQDS